MRGRIVVCALGVLCGCGPTVATPGSEESSGTDSTTGSATSESSASTSEPDPTTSSSTRGASSSESSSSTGAPPEPVHCVDDFDPEFQGCCEDIEQPCDVVAHDCTSEEVDCDADPFSGDVQDADAARCMLQQLAEPQAALLQRRSNNGFATAEQYWIPSPDRTVTVVAVYTADFSVGTSMEQCQLAPADQLAACAAQADPTVLAQCLADAALDCEPVEEALCPP